MDFDQFLQNIFEIFNTQFINFLKIVEQALVLNI